MSSDAKPLLALLSLETVACGTLLLWWLAMPAVERVARLLVIMQKEGIPEPPPLLFTLEGCVLQGQWLLEARLGHLVSMAVLWGMLLVGGIVEGWYARRRDPLAGKRLSWWILGTGLLVLLPGILGGFVLSPWPVPLFWCGLGFGAYIACLGGTLMFGRPSLP